MKVINNKRLGIYFFYDKQGIVDRFVPYFLDDLCKNLTKLIIICNGKLNDEGKEILLPAIKDVLKQVDLENKKIIVHIIEGLI